MTGLMVHRSIVVNYLEQTFFYDEDIAIACVYFDHKTVYEPVAILKSILKHVQHRILRKEGTISEDMRQFYKNHLREERKPSLSEISEMLSLELRRNFSEIFIVLDALDECSVDANPRKIILQELQKLQANLRLMVTGRPFAATHMTVFEASDAVEIRATASDVERFVSSQIDNDESLQKHAAGGTELRRKIINSVVTKAEGM
jgi:hypothetical protein